MDRLNFEGVNIMSPSTASLPESNLPLEIIVPSMFNSENTVEANNSAGFSGDQDNNADRASLPLSQIRDNPTKEFQPQSNHQSLTHHIYSFFLGGDGEHLS